MTTKNLSKKGVVGVAIFAFLGFLLTSCDPLTLYQKPRRENVPLNRIMIPPTKKTDYIGINVEDSIAIFYTFHPAKLTVGNVFNNRKETDCVWYAQWYKYKGEYWFLLRAITGKLSSNEGSFASIHLQMSPKDWVVHKASVYFYDKPRMCDLYIPSITDEDVRRDMSIYGLSLVAREDINVDIYNGESSMKCIKGVITGTFTEWSSFHVNQDNSSCENKPPYSDFYPTENLHWGYSPVDTPKKFQLSFTAVEAFQLCDFEVIEEE